MTPAEHLAMSVDSNWLEGLSAWERLDLVRSEGDPWRALTPQARHVLSAAVALESIDVDASYLDEATTEHLADCVVAQSHRLRGVA